jgi:hypothetical protein
MDCLKLLNPKVAATGKSERGDKYHNNKNNKKDIKLKYFMETVFVIIQMIIIRYLNNKNLEKF